MSAERLTVNKISLDHKKQFVVPKIVFFADFACLAVVNRRNLTEALTRPIADQNSSLCGAPVEVSLDLSAVSKTMVDAGIFGAEGF